MSGRVAQGLLDATAGVWDVRQPGQRCIELITDEVLANLEETQDFRHAVARIPPPQPYARVKRGEHGEWVPNPEPDRVRKIWWSAVSEGHCPCGRSAERVPIVTAETTFTGPGQGGRTGRPAPFCEDSWHAVLRNGVGPHGEPQAGESLDLGAGWMHCWTCRWSFRFSREGLDGQTGIQEGVGFDAERAYKGEGGSGAERAYKGTEPYNERDV